MDRVYIIGLITIGCLSVQLSHGATTSSPSSTQTSQTEAEQDAGTTSGVTGTTPSGTTEDNLNVSSCPRFNNRHDNGTLYVPYIEGRCEMTVTVETVTLPPLLLVKMFKRGKRVIRRPVVSFRTIDTELDGEAVTCESLPSRALGPFVFVDTVAGECQMLLKVQRRKNGKIISRGPGDRKWWKPWLRPGKRPGNRPRIEKFTFVPAYEYLDEVVY
ncbi:uncharacterized protein LOC132559859 [Ylistrum balloti]|uniref:uncharacterized protein LOC132559859 n=1 Tax=Ylistrum balloti TaxID=509963 RepID=UPI002905E4A2|nr:uncharacterized protein LOC132559859 [Ylistrum balloti]